MMVTYKNGINLTGGSAHIAGLAAATEQDAGVAD